MGWFSVLRIGVSDLHNSRWMIGADSGQAVTAAELSAAGVNVGPAVFSAQYYPFREHGKPLQRHGTVNPNSGIGQNAIVKRQVNAVVIPVKCHRLYIDISIQQVSAPHLCTGAGVQNTLGAFGQIDPQILNAILITAAVRYLLSVDGKGLLQIFCTATDTSLTTLRHGNTSPLDLGILDKQRL